MTTSQPLTADVLKSFTIRVSEPFSAFLMGTPEESEYEISLLDVVRFSGHACPSMVGAFLIAKKAIEELYPETGVCVRGDLEIDLPGLAIQGAMGPISNVFGFITGAWGETGFGGLRGVFIRRHLMQFGVADVPLGAFRFTRTSTGTSTLVSYDPGRALLELDPKESFQMQWRRKIKACLDQPELVVWSEETSPYVAKEQQR